MTENNNITKTLLQFAGQKNVITVYRAFVDFTGSIETAIMLSQLLYWTPRSSMDGWIAKSDLEFQEELCLSRHAVRKARSILKEMEIIEAKNKRFKGSPTTHYKVDLDVLTRQWIVRNQTMDCSNENNGLSEIGQSLTEITPKITKEDPPPEKPKRTKSQYIINMEYLEKVYADARPCPLPDWNKKGAAAGLNERWRKPLKEILELCDGNLSYATTVIRKVNQDMKNDGMINDAPGSILKNAKSLIYDHYSRQQRNMDAPNYTTDRIEETEQQKAMEQQSP